jgi:hypothetical protein
LEIHFQPSVKGGKRSHQPFALAAEARDFLTGRLGLNPVPYSPPNNTRVKPPVPHDGTRGYILSRSLEIHGRPVAFVFAGNTFAPDGLPLQLSVPVLKKSLNYQLVANGEAYPLYYDTLFAELRNALTVAAMQARKAKGKTGFWAQDKTQVGLKVTTQLELENNGVIFPKLFRRLTDFLATPNNGGISKFSAWLKAKEEQVLDLDTNNFTHFDNLVLVQNGKVKLTRLPERIVFVSQK